jgi:hypothetical protein
MFDIKKKFIYICITHFNKLVAKNWMIGKCHIWFEGQKYQLSTPTFDYGMVLSYLNVSEFYLFVISSLGVYGIT